MFLIVAIIWTVICVSWALKGLGWPLWDGALATGWHELGPLGQVDDSSLSLVVLIALWVAGLVVMTALRGKRA